MKKAISLGIIASFFFAFTFVLNHEMNISGGSWFWSASLRYIFMLPMLFALIVFKNGASQVIKQIIKKPSQWFIWSTVGFGLFYAPLTFSSVYGASWLVAGTWQITIIAGALLSPLFFKTIETEAGTLKVRNKIPRKSLLMSLIILLGIFLMQLQEAKNISFSHALIGVIPAILAAFCYPLGNRKMMEVCNNDLDTFQRVFGMTLCSMPFWIVISICGFYFDGFPSSGQVFQSLIVAIFSGIVATVLFFKATDLVKNHPHKLAVVESTQAGEVIFTLLGGVFLFNDKVPSLVCLLGLALVVIGMTLNSLVSS
ncbi:MAG: multidrug resistance efflux transporter family protein [Clostridiaceae bacterium]